MDATLSECPFSHTTEKNRTLSFTEMPPQNLFKKIVLQAIELMSRFSYKSLKNSWQIGTQNDLSKTLARAWKPGSIMSKCRTPIGTIYLTADPEVMRTVLQNYRANDQGLFFDHENKKLFVKQILNDLYPDEISHYGIDQVADMIPISASIYHIKSLRAPLVSALSPSNVKDFIPQMNIIADDILRSLSEEEKSNCNAEELAFEFAITVISKFITGYDTNRENYQALGRTLNHFGKKMTRLLSHRLGTKTEEQEYQDAIKSIKEIIHSNITTDQPSSFILKLKELGWDNFRISANLFFMYFAASETTASSINYLLWQLGKEENKIYLEELRHPEQGENFLSKVVAETLRLHPPAFIFGRQLRCDTSFQVKDPKGKILKKMTLLQGHTILCLSQVAARDSTKYPDPDAFNPRRFTNIPAQLPWYPFGTGHHVCPGQHLAYAELRVLCSQIVKKFNIQNLSPKEQTQQRGLFTLRASTTYLKLSDLS